jgi:hypothetical protein
MNRYVITVLMAALAVLSSGCFLNVTSHRQPDGSLVYAGEVYNEGAPLSSPSVEGTFFDAAGNVITTRTAPVCTVLPSKSVSAFRVSLPPGIQDPARVEWKLLGDEVADAYVATGLSATVTNIVPEGGVVDMSSVYGEIRNDSDRQYRGASLCIGWANDKGEILDVGYGFGAGWRLDPGGVMPFEVQIDNIPEDATHLNFYLDAGVTPTGPAPSVVDLPGSALQHGFTVKLPTTGGIFSLTGVEVHNSTQQSRIPAVVPTIRDGSGKLLSTSGTSTFCQVTAPPGGFTYASYSLTRAGADMPAPTVRVEARERGEGALLPHVLEPSNVTRSNESNDHTTVKATIKNTSGVTLTRINACAGVYDATGNLVGVFPTITPLRPVGGLAPNASMSVTIDVPTFGTAASAKMIADGFE